MVRGLLGTRSICPQRLKQLLCCTSGIVLLVCCWSATTNIHSGIICLIVIPACATYLTTVTCGHLDGSRRILFVMVVFIVSVALTVHLLSTLSMWCVMRVRDMDNMCFKLNEVVKLFTHHNITHFICYGSLLGSYRHALPIAHEHDSDLCGFSTDETRILQALKSTNLEYKYFADNKYMKFRVYLGDSSWPGKLVSMRYSVAEIWVDVYLMKPRTGYYQGPDGKIDKDMIIPTRIIPYCHSNMPAPRDLVGFLTHTFGSTFNISTLPDGYKYVTCTIYYDK